MTPLHKHLHTKFLSIPSSFTSLSPAKMKQSFLLTLSLVFLLVSYTASARVLVPKSQQVTGDQKLKDADDHGIANDKDISNLMGLEDICGSEGEECTAERKLLAEAHLDYIYTQNNPSP